MKYFIKDNFLSNEQFCGIKEIFDTSQIDSYCSNPENPEHESYDDGNLSFPAEFARDADKRIFSIFDNSFLKSITKTLSGTEIDHQFSYANFHYDLPNSSLPIHNDLKDYRWMVTAQLYIEGDKNDGVVLFDQHQTKEIPVNLFPNTFYCLWADPYSWHYVNPIKKDKKSLLIRWGQRKIFTVVNKDETEKTAILIVGDFQHNDDDLKVGVRSQNLTEAWLINQGYKNIYNSPWKDSKGYTRILFYLLKNYNKVCIVPSGYLGEGNLFEKPCVLITDDFKDYTSMKESIDLETDDVIKITKSKLSQVKETIFTGNGIDLLAKAEKILYNTNIVDYFLPIDPKSII